MDIPQALALLKRLLDDVPRLKRLASSPKNAELPTWDDEVKRTIKETFGRNSKEYARYDGIFSLKYVKTQADKELAYIDYISQREKALRDIIQEYDIPAKNNKSKKTSLKFPWLSLKPNIYGVGVDLKKFPILRKWFGEDRE
jgi:hypothetical protein